MKAMIIGGGFIAATHIEAIRRAGHEVCCVVGRDPVRTEAFARENNISEWYTDTDTALKCDADIVHICTPPYNHAELIRKCLAADKHIICEKPLCIDPAEAEALAEEARIAYEEKGIVTALCCNVRYYPANQEASRRIRSGEIGAMVLHGFYLQEFHIPPHPDGWRFDDELSEGMRAISEIGTHWIDLAYAWTGVKIREVFADLRCWYPKRYRKDGMLTLDKSGEVVEVNTEDTAAILLRFENGGIGTLLLSETAPGHPNDLTIEYTDLKISYKWEESAADTLYISEGGILSGETVPSGDRISTFSSLFEAVYEAAETGKTSEHPDFEDGAYIAKVCSAIKRSSQLGTWIRI